MFKLWPVQVVVVQDEVFEAVVLFATTECVLDMDRKEGEMRTLYTIRGPILLHTMDVVETGKHTHASTIVTHSSERRRFTHGNGSSATIGG